MPTNSIRSAATASATDSQPLASATWDREDETTPVYAVVSAVADAASADPVELSPLNTVIDPDALNSLFTAQANTTTSQIRFQYEGYSVVVREQGAVEVYSS